MKRKLLFTLGLVLVTLAVYLQVRHFDYIDLDDHLYVTENYQIQQGFSLSAISWAFTAVYESTWQPLVWLSYMLDFKLGGLNPGGYHVTNIILHILNTLLLLTVLNRITREFWKSFIVAALFALHPLHVESVAWIAERKDVLSTFFLFLTLWAYTWYLDRPALLRYLVCILFFILGFLAKPMVVSLPVMLLLFDFWPLGRITSSSTSQFRLPWKLLQEKIPFLILSALFCLIAFWAQSKGNGVRSFNEYPIGIRLENAIVSYVQYIGKMFWPFDLGVYYPHPGENISITLVVISAIFLVCISILIVRSNRRYPFIFFGWLWYLITLLPVIGLIQFGGHGLADRFTYIPLIGLFVIVAWGIPELLTWILSRFPQKIVHIAPLRWGLCITAGLALSLLSFRTYDQVRYWKNDLTLFYHTSEVTLNNKRAELLFCSALNKAGLAKEAIPLILDLAQRFPDDLDVLAILAIAYEKNGNLDKAVAIYMDLLKEYPTSTELYHNLANVFVAQKKMDRAIHLRREAIRREPDNPIFHVALAQNLTTQGHYLEAWKEVLLARKLGYLPHPKFLKDLSRKMPEPRE